MQEIEKSFSFTRQSVKPLKRAKTRWLSKTYHKGDKMNRFAFVVCHSGRIEFVIPEINLRGSEPTENIDDVVSLLVNRYNVGEYQVV